MTVLNTEVVQRELKRGKSAPQIAKKYKVTRQAVWNHINKLRKKERRPEARPKKNYNLLIDWKVYNEGLVKRGEFLLDFSLFKDWKGELRLLNEGKRGRPFEFPGSFILFFNRLKFLFKIDYRTLEGIARKLVIFIPAASRAPDYTTFWVRLARVGYELEVYEGALSQDIAGDTSGLKTANSGEYRMSKYGSKRRKFLKLHLAVNIQTKQIIYCDVTKEEVRDGEKLPDMVLGVRRLGKVNNGYFDAGYDSIRNYGILEEEGINPVIRPRRSASLARTKELIREMEVRGIEDERAKACYARLRCLEEYLTDEEGWKKQYKYGKRWVVEGRYSVFKRMFSEHVYSKKLENIRREVILKSSLINWFTYLARERSELKPSPRLWLRSPPDNSLSYLTSI